MPAIFGEIIYFVIERYDNFEKKLKSFSTPTVRWINVKVVPVLLLG